MVTVLGPKDLVTGSKVLVLGPKTLKVLVLGPKVIVYLCICVFVCLCICVFVYLCILCYCFDDIRHIIFGGMIKKNAPDVFALISYF